MLESSETVRFGGHEVDGVFRFELSGGSLALDLANTLDQRAGSPRELLQTAGDLVSWAVQSNALRGGDAKTLLKMLDNDAQTSARLLGQAIALREALFELFVAVSRNEEPSREALSELNECAERTLRYVPLSYDDGRFAFLPSVAKEPISLLAPVVRDALDLLLDRKRLGRLRVCAGETCDWLFLDGSPRANRKWCDMSVCGNRAKVRKFRSSQKVTR